MRQRLWFLVGIVLALLAFPGITLAAEYFSVVVLPDTQVYSKSHPEIFKAQTEWIVRNQDYYNIRFVLHEGDVVDSGAQNVAEWEAAKAAIDVLDEAGIPTLIAIGNHDYDDLAQTRSSNVFNQYFGLERYEGKPWFGGAFEPGKAENVYALFDIGGETYMVLVLEFGPRDEVIDWANEVVAAHPDAKVIVLTHSFLHNDGWRVEEGTEWSPNRYGLGADANAGEALWHKLVKKHPNIFLVLNGHVLGTGTARRVDVGEHGNLVFQVLANYQMRANGGDGYLRILEFQPDGRIEVSTYSPYVWANLTDPANQFVLDPSVLTVIGGELVNQVTGQAVARATVTLEDALGNVVAGVRSDDQGRYDIVVPEGCYIVRAELTGYEGSAGIVSTPGAGQCVVSALSLRPIGVWAGRGRTLTGNLAEGTAADVMLMNEQISMVIADTFEDAQVSPVTKGKPVDLAVTGMDDAFDWIIMPYISLSEPRDWPIRTVRTSTVEVVDVTGEYAIVEADGVFTENPDLVVTTTYTIEKDRPWIHVVSVFENKGDSDITVWIGDVMDNDDGTQVAIVPGQPPITSGAAFAWEPAAPWMGQYGSTAQAFALVYDGNPEGFDLFGGALWILSRIPVTIPAGGQYELSRYIVAVPTEGYAEKADAVAAIANHLITPHIWAFEDEAELATIGNDNTGATFALVEDMGGEGRYMLQVTPSGEAAETKIAAPLEGIAIMKWMDGETLVVRTYFPPENELQPAQFFVGMADLTDGWEWVDGLFATTELVPGWNDIEITLPAKMRSLNLNGSYMVYMSFIEATRTPLVDPFYVDYVTVR